MNYHEREVEKKFVQLCRKNNWVAIKFGYQGWPDRIVVKPNGKVVWVELKSTRGYLSAWQRERAKELTKLEHKVYVLKGTTTKATFKLLTKRELRIHEKISKATKKAIRNRVRGKDNKDTHGNSGQGNTGFSVAFIE